MGLLEDIMKTLERIPAWKRLQGLPDHVQRLEARIAQLEAQLGPAAGDVCPKCKARTFRLISSRPHPTFGRLGGLEDTLTCSNCQHTEQRLRDP